MIEMKKYNGGKLPKRDMIVYTENGFFSIFYRDGGHVSFDHLGGNMQNFHLHNHKVLAYCEMLSPNIKDTMRTHNGFTFEWEEADGDTGYVSCPGVTDFFYEFTNDPENNHAIELRSRRLISNTKEQAISLAKAMIGIDTSGVEQDDNDEDDDYEDYRCSCCED